MATDRVVEVKEPRGMDLIPGRSHIGESDHGPVFIYISHKDKKALEGDAEAKAKKAKKKRK